MRILGIDPGSRRTGVGVVDVQGQRVLHVHHRVIATADEAFPQRLAEIFEGVRAVIAEFEPGEAAVETVFMARNAASALKLGQARGAAICAIVAAGLAVHEYTPGEIKQAVVGGGRAEKAQVQHMVGLLLNLHPLPDSDPADALAAAIAHAHHRQTAQRVGLPSGWRRR
ncbi:MAG: crossover junction endodeoxyribonuclease RuvC [Lysobacterales bacterium]